jgi:hypothetical protein
MEIAARFDIRQDVEHNLGRVIGVQTGAIYGNVYGGDLTQVQVYALTGEGRTATWRRFLGEKTPPYKGLSPYTAQDQALFKGRDAKVEQVIRQAGVQRQLVVYGRTGMGKTSLLAAGVIPVLMQYGALVIHLSEYAQPLEKTIRIALDASADQIHIPRPDGLSLPALVRAVRDATGGTLILVLDQFERLFQPPINENERAAKIEGLAQALQAVEPEYLRLIVVVRTGALERLVELQDYLPDLWCLPIPIWPLSREQAQVAIEAPLAELNYPGGVSYGRGLVAERLVPDLDELYPRAADQIVPAHLQIVCDQLFQAAWQRRPPHIDEGLYRELGGAEGVLAAHVENTLETKVSAEKVLAKQLMQAIAYPGLGPWVPTEQLPRNGSSLGQVRDVLERLVKAALLVRRAVNGRREYAFASPVVAQKVREDAPRRYEAAVDLQHVWSAWLVHKSLAGRVQLQHMQQDRALLSPTAVQVLLLLRSAVALDMLDNPWPAQLRSTNQGTELMRQLEEPDAPGLTWYGATSTLEQAELLLGLRAKLADSPGDGRGAFGPIAQSAVRHPQPVTRQTAALALTALEPYPQAALDRLRWAMAANAKGWRHWARKAELRGTLADADPAEETLRSNLTTMDRVGMWGWRARRRLIRDRQRIAALMVGGGIGAGLALGLLRAATGALAGRMVGIQFAMYFWWAWLLGAALSLGMALSEPLLLGRQEKRGTTPPIWRAPLHPDRLPTLLAVVLGTLFFGLSHLLVAWFNGLSLTKAPLVAPMGFVAGLGLSLGLYGQPRAGWRLGIFSWLLRLGVAALTLVGTQWVFIWTEGGKGQGIAIAWVGTFYWSAFGDCERPWWQRFVNSVPQWPDYLALLDAVLVGVVLTVGIAAGMILAAKALVWSRERVNRAEG